MTQNPPFDNDLICVDSIANVARIPMCFRFDGMRAWVKSTGIIYKLNMGMHSWWEIERIILMNNEFRRSITPWSNSVIREGW